MKIKKQTLKDPCLYPGCENKTPTDYPWCKFHKADKYKLPFEPIRKGSKIVLGRDSGYRGTVAGYTFQDINGHPQMFYVVEVEPDWWNGSLSVNVVVDFILVHPDNLSTVSASDRKAKEEAALDGVVELGQADNSFKIKTNAPGSQVELVRYKIVRRGRLTARKMVKRLKKLGWRARIVEEEGR